MRAFPSHSGRYGRLNRRERRLIAAGSAVVVTALLTVFAVLPFARRWAAREDALAASREQLVRLHGLLASEARLRQSVDEQRRAREARRDRLLSGATPAVAASTLQSLIQRYAEQSGVTLDRVNVVGDPAAPDSGGVPAIPMELSAQGDVYGLMALLYQLQYGEKLLVIDELTVNGNAFDADEGPPLTWSIRLRAPYLTAGPT